MGNSFDIQYVIDNIKQFDLDTLLSFDFCKLLDTPRYKNDNIVVFSNGMFYSLVSSKFVKKGRRDNKPHLCISIKNIITQKETTMVVPYIICYLFRNDHLKHRERERNVFNYLDGNNDNCSADNIRANYYEYEIISRPSETEVCVDICGKNVLLNSDFVENELHKYNFHVHEEGRCIYFESATSGKTKRLHQIVMNYYCPKEIITGAIDHCNHDTLDNRIQNLEHVHPIINSMNNMDISPNWIEQKQAYRVTYRLGGKKYSRTFSLSKYGTKESAYNNAMKYVNDVVIPRKQEYIREKDYELKVQELDNLFKYFVSNGMTDVIYKILIDNGIREVK